jgi:hypothetical protein
MGSARMHTIVPLASKSEQYQTETNDCGAEQEEIVKRPFSIRVFGKLSRNEGRNQSSCTCSYHQ